MVTKKTPSSISDTGDSVTIQTEKKENCCSENRGRHIGWGGWLRICIAVLLVVGAYIWGVMAGLDARNMDGKGRGEWGSRGYENRYKDDNRKFRGNPKNNMPMMDHDMSNMDPMDMSMRDMGKMLEGKTGAELDKAFLQGMIPHHQGAIDMAKYLARSDKPELVKLGADIIAAQQKEIDQMNTWIKEWGYTSTRTATTQSGAMHMMPDGTMMMNH